MIRRGILFLSALGCWVLAYLSWDIWTHAAANSASPGAVVLLFFVGFFSLLGLSLSLSLWLAWGRRPPTQ